MSEARAAVDVGTNSVRLLVVDASGRRLARELRITRLGSGVDRTGYLDDAALGRTLSAITAYRERWVGLGVVDHVRIAATSAIRDASDRDRFLDAVRDITGVEAEVLSGSAEAALAYAGASSATDVAAPAAVVDVGGGSTEVIVGGVDGSVAASTSLQLGCVRLTERCLTTDPPTPGQIAAAEAEIEAQLERADQDLSGAPLGGAAGLIAVAGTATTLAALHLGLDTYQEERIHGTRLPRAALEDLTARLLGATAAQRARLGPMQPGREDVIHAGALVLRAVVRRTTLDEVVVSESDNLDGLTASMA